MMTSVATVSAVRSNTAATAFFVPSCAATPPRSARAPPGFLLPLAFASILTSSVTLISTSTNLAVSDFLTRFQQAPMGMFELAPVGLPITIVGLLYMWLLGVRLMPQRQEPKAEEKIGEADAVVMADGPLVGKSPKEATLTWDTGLAVVKVLRDGETLRGEKRISELSLLPGDELIIEGLRADLLKIKDIDGLDFKADLHL